MVELRWPSPVKISVLLLEILGKAKVIRLILDIPPKYLNCEYFNRENGSVLATAGMSADAQYLVKVLGQKLEFYEYQHDKKMPTPSVAQLLQCILYGKRFFPYFVWNTLGGLDKDGKGCVFSYDPVGNYERRPYNCGGSAQSLIQPFLDNQVGRQHLGDQLEMSIEETKRVVMDAFTSATERDIYTGDFVEIFTVTKQGTSKEIFPLKRD